MILTSLRLAFDYDFLLALFHATKRTLMDFDMRDVIIDIIDLLMSRNFRIKELKEMPPHSQMIITF